MTPSPANLIYFASLICHSSYKRESFGCGWIETLIVEGEKTPLEVIGWYLKFREIVCQKTSSSPFSHSIYTFRVTYLDSQIVIPKEKSGS